MLILSMSNMSASENKQGANLPPGQGSSETSAGENFVRLSQIRVKPERPEEYTALLKEEIEASMRLETGELVLYALSEKERPNHISILEIYQDVSAYKRHLGTPHFQKYKQGTLDMVLELKLIDSIPLIPGLKIK